MKLLLLPITLITLFVGTAYAIGYSSDADAYGWYQEDPWSIDPWDDPFGADSPNVISDCIDGGPGSTSCISRESFELMGNGASLGCSVTCDPLTEYACCGLKCRCHKVYENN